MRMINYLWVCDTSLKLLCSVTTLIVSLIPQYHLKPSRRKVLIINSDHYFRIWDFEPEFFPRRQPPPPPLREQQHPFVHPMGTPLSKGGASRSQSRSQLPFPLPTDDAYPIQPSMQKATWVALLRSYYVYVDGAFEKFTGYHRDRTNSMLKIVWMLLVQSIPKKSYKVSASPIKTFRQPAKMGGKRNLHLLWMKTL